MIKKLLLIFIFFIAFILRFSDLGSNPPSLDWDEASLGYNAYSLLKTGKDEYGEVLPLSIRSFGDYKPPLYTYLTIIPIWLFGLNEFSTRFISALFGTLTVIIAYYLIKELFPNKPPVYCLLFTIYFALSPWHLQFSRVAFESNLALFFLIMGIWLFLKGVSNGKFFLLSSLSFVLSMYSYHSPRLIIPVLLVGLLILYRKDLKIQKKWLIAAFAIMILFISPIIYSLSTSTTSRLGSVTILNPFERLGSSIRDIEYDESKNDLLGKLTHNRRIVYAKEIVAGYLDHFNFDFLFLYGDAPARHHAADMGMLYLWDLPFIIIGILYLLKNPTRNIYMLFLWFLLAPVASSLTTGTPHAVRALFYLPIYQIFITFGLIEVIRFARGPLARLKITLISFIFLLFILNFFYYLHMYWVHTPTEYAKEWQYGYKQAVEEVAKIESRFEKIIVTYHYDQPYIFFLFYNKVDPTWYQNNWNQGEIKRAERAYGKYVFRSIDWEKDSGEPNTLLVATPSEIPENVPGLLKEIYFPDGKVAFRIRAN